VGAVVRKVDFGGYKKREPWKSRFGVVKGIGAVKSSDLYKNS